MVREPAYENRCIRRRNAMVAAVRVLALAALRPSTDRAFIAETDRAFTERKERAESAVERTTWIRGFFINVGDAGFTKAQEKVLLKDLREVFTAARITVRRATKLHKRFIEVAF